MERRNPGRPPMHEPEYGQLQRMAIRCTAEEFSALLELLPKNTRDRYEFLMELLRNQDS